ncbi:MAG: ABC transporter substrate-binding protein [Ancrocorticia sp.]
MTATFLRRGVAAVAATLLSAVLLTACGSNSSESAGDASSGGSDPSSNDSASYPVTVISDFGELTLESEPQRIVALTHLTFDTLLALEIEPVGGLVPTVVMNKDAPWYEGKLDDVASIDGGNRKEIDYEAIAALKPDLILAGGGFAGEDTWDRLNEIAPTAGDFKVPGEDNWVSTLKNIGVLTNNEAKAESVLSSVQKKIDDATASFSLEGKTALYATAYQGNYMAFISPDDKVNQIFAQFGMSLPDGLEGQDQAAISMENYQLLDADILFFAASTVSEATTLDRVPAVAEGRVAYVDDTYALGLVSPSALNLPVLIDDVLVPAFKTS